MKLATVATAAGTLMAALAAVGALYFSNSTLSATNEQLGLARRTAQTDQIKAAAEQLDSDKESVRLSGIYLLERLAQDSEADRPALRRLLEAFVRTESTSVPCELPTQEVPAAFEQAPADIQAALDIITKYSALPDPTPGVNLQGACLADANLARANLTDADLTGANLTGADLVYADLTDANLFETTLTDAALTADLTNAVLLGANLTDANLGGANLTDADLTRANLTGVAYDDSTRWPVGFIPPPPARP